ncbi:MAG: beta-ketoacyl synthase N-terminal-like domain-containing protein, partial [Myxococcota bacterium]|nr:beta-ketoacyl synthase N-terminal-like domain-containing protein [Myxococcota bacterium]
MSEPIAVVGMACLFPGASSPEALFELSLEGRTSFRPIPESRWRHDAFHDASPRGRAPTGAPAGAVHPHIEPIASACVGNAPPPAQGL